MKNKPSFCENKPLFYEKQVVVLRKSFYDEMHQTGKSVVFALYPRNADEFVPPFWVQVKDFGEISPKGIAVSVEFSVSQLVCESGHKGLQRCPLLEKRLEGRVLQEFL